MNNSQFFLQPSIYHAVQWLAKYGFVWSQCFYIKGTTSCNLAVRRKTKWLPGPNSFVCQRNKQTMEISGNYQGQGKIVKFLKTRLIISKITKMYFNNWLCCRFHYCFTFLLLEVKGNWVWNGITWEDERTNKNKTFEVFRTLLKEAPYIVFNMYQCFQLFN